jgi:hypothetical protein
MALDFPNAPTVGQKYPQPSIPGVPTYGWDGEKWTTNGGAAAVGAGPSNAVPTMDGAGASGISVNYTRGDHVHPSDTSRAAKSYVDSQDNAIIANYQAADNARVAKSGDTMSGPLTVGGTLTTNDIITFRDADHAAIFFGLNQAQYIYFDGTQFQFTHAVNLAGGGPVAPYNATPKNYVDAGDATSLKIAGGQNLTGGFSFTVFVPTLSGTFTPDPTKGNYQHGTNNGAFTLAAPAVDCAIDLMVTNGASAGAITFSGFYVSANTGDALSTTNGAHFIISIRRISNLPTYTIKALQ